jgi:D-glycero-D-manno-heptose 1,7-bisphosphate phosphatase
MRAFELLILDVDGTLRYTTTPGARYPLRREEQRLLPNVREALSALDYTRTRLAIASNQNGVARGELTRAAAEELIVEILIEAIGYFPTSTIINLCTCPEDPPCDCRKPAPGLLLRALEATRVPAQGALYVGDLDIDSLAAKRAGIRFTWAHDFFRAARAGRSGA